MAFSTIIARNSHRIASHRKKQIKNRNGQHRNSEDVIASHRHRERQHRETSASGKIENKSHRIASANFRPCIHSEHCSARVERSEHVWPQIFLNIWPHYDVQRTMSNARCPTYGVHHAMSPYNVHRAMSNVRCPTCNFQRTRSILAKICGFSQCDGFRRPCSNFSNRPYAVAHIESRYNSERYSCLASY